MWIELNDDEVALLDRQDRGTAQDGGFQGMLVGFQKSLRRSTGELKLSDDDVDRIARYAFDFKNGGWQTRLVGIFGRTLGPTLGREPQSSDETPK